MNPNPKVSKKQRKVIAFRERKLSGTQGTAKDIPEQEVDDNEARINVPSTQPASKRKLVIDVADGDEFEATDISRKRTKVDDLSSKPKKNQRFILFVGNLRYTTTKDTIAEHFWKCDPPPTVRLVSPKHSTKSKGCAFVEFSQANALQQGLKLHHTVLEGRKINVELTAGGGGKSEKRLKKLRERNRTLGAQRNKTQSSLHGPQVDTKADESEGVGYSSRVSLTSGVDTRPKKKKTWSVGSLSAGENSRGCKRHKSAKSTHRRTPQHYTPTGANAIAVG